MEQAQASCKWRPAVTAEVRPLGALAKGYTSPGKSDLDAKDRDVVTKTTGALAAKPDAIVLLSGVSTIPQACGAKCGTRQEPGIAVKEALVAGGIAADRVKDAPAGKVPLAPATARRDMGGVASVVLALGAPTTSFDSWRSKTRNLTVAGFFQSAYLAFFWGIQTEFDSCRGFLDDLGLPLPGTRREPGHCRRQASDRHANGSTRNPRSGWHPPGNRRGSPAGCRQASFTQ